MSESTSPFRAAVELKDPDAMTSVLAEDVSFRSPAVFKAYEGREATMNLLRLVLTVFEDFSYVSEIRDGDEEVLRFKARVGDREVDGVDILRYDSDGLVCEMSVMVRPLSGLMALRDAMGAKLAEMGIGA